MILLSFFTLHNKIKLDFLLKTGSADPNLFTKSGLKGFNASGFECDLKSPGPSLAANCVSPPRGQQGGLVHAPNLADCRGGGDVNAHKQ